MPIRHGSRGAAFLFEIYNQPLMKCLISIFFRTPRRARTLIQGKYSSPTPPHAQEPIRLSCARALLPCAFPLSPNGQTLMAMVMAMLMLLDEFTFFVLALHESFQQPCFKLGSPELGPTMLHGKHDFTTVRAVTLKVQKMRRVRARSRQLDSALVLLMLRLLGDSTTRASRHRPTRSAYAAPPAVARRRAAWA